MCFYELNKNEILTEENLNNNIIKKLKKLNEIQKFENKIYQINEKFNEKQNKKEIKKFIYLIPKIIILYNL